MVSRKRCLEIANEVEQVTHHDIECHTEEDYLANLDIVRVLRAYAGLMEDDPTVTEDDVDKVTHLSCEDLAKYVRCLGSKSSDIAPGNGKEALPSKTIAFECAFRICSLSAVVKEIAKQRDKAEMEMYHAQAELAKFKREVEGNGK